MTCNVDEKEKKLFDRGGLKLCRPESRDVA